MVDEVVASLKQSLQSGILNEVFIYLFDKSKLLLVVTSIVLLRASAILSSQLLNKQ